MTSDSEARLRDVLAIRGVLGAVLVDFASGYSVHAAGQTPTGDHHSTARRVADLTHSTLTNAIVTRPGRTGRVDDIVLTAGNGYHVLHFLPATAGPPLVLYVWLDRILGNLAMTQHRLRTTGNQLLND